MINKILNRAKRPLKTQREKKTFAPLSATEKRLDGSIRAIDWYDPVKTCLERIGPQLVVGRSLVLYGYQDWDGCIKAGDEFFKNFTSPYAMIDTYGSVKITRLR